MGEKTISLYSYVQLNENRYADKSIRVLKTGRGIVDQQADGPVLLKITVNKKVVQAKTDIRFHQGPELPRGEVQHRDLRGGVPDKDFFPNASKQS